MLTPPSHSISLTRSLAVLATTGLLLSGCSGDDIAEQLAEEAAEQAGGGEVDIDSDDGSVSIESDDGSSLNIGSQDLPEGLPDELPLPDGLSVQGSMSQQDDDGSTIGFQAAYDGAFDDAKAFFDAELEAAGWTITNSTTSDASGLRSASWQVEGFGHEGLVTVAQVGEDGDDDTMTSVSVNLQSSSDSDS